MKKHITILFYILFAIVLHGQAPALSYVEGFNNKENEIILLQEPSSMNMKIAALYDLDKEVTINDDFDFIYRYYKTVESSLNRNKKVGKLGRREIDGLKSGTFYYHCKLAGWNRVLISMVYTNYCDFDFVINGICSLEVNWKACGVMKGKIFADGPAKGVVDYDLIINEGIENEGFYYLKQSSSQHISKIPAMLVLGFANRDIELDENVTISNK